MLTRGAGLVAPETEFGSSSSSPFRSRGNSDSRSTREIEKVQSIVRTPPWRGVVDKLLEAKIDWSKLTIKEIRSTCFVYLKKNVEKKKKTLLVIKADKLHFFKNLSQLN